VIWPPQSGLGKDERRRHFFSTKDTLKVYVMEQVLQEKSTIKPAVEHLGPMGSTAKQFAPPPN
jgi:hypothetical protein